MNDDSDLPNNQDHVDLFMELNRAVSIFSATTKLLAFSAIMIVVVSTNDTFYNIFMVDEELEDDLYKLPESLRVIMCVVLLQNTIICALGIYGYALLKRHLLAYYGFQLILLLLWFFFFSVTAYSRNESFEPIVNLFKNYEKSVRARAAVHILEARFRCCGSKYHNHKDDEKFRGDIVPPNCCISEPDEDDLELCETNQTFPDLCQTNRTTIYSSIRDTGRLPSLAYVCLGAFVVTSLEAYVTFSMVRRLNQEATTIISSRNIFAQL